MNTFKSTDEAIDTLIKIEEEEVGYLEKKSNAQLDSKTANAGYNNYTKYWRDINKWGLFSYSSDWAGGPDWSWCAGLQTWCFVKAFGKDNAKKLLLHLPFISCYNMGEKAKTKLTSTPKKGDIVLFSKSGVFKHTGLVYNVDTSYVYTIEGNTGSASGVVANGGAVAKKKYALSTMKSAGHKFFSPDYSIVVSDTASSTVSTTKKPTAQSSISSVDNTSSTTMIINTKKDPLRCRNTASISGTIVGKFAKGATVTLLEKTNASFYKVTGKDVTTGKTITGYCASSYLKNTSKSNTSSSTTMIINTKKDPLRCRNTASISGTIVGKFAKGATVTLLEKTNASFYKVTGKDVTTGKTITGYCASSYLKSN